MDRLITFLNIASFENSCHLSGEFNLLFSYRQIQSDSVNEKCFKLMKFYFFEYFYHAEILYMNFVIMCLFLTLQLVINLCFHFWNPIWVNFMEYLFFMPVN